MTPLALYSLSANPFLTWTLLASKIGEMTLASAQVIGQRSNRMAMSGMPPNARDQREFSLMSQEKVMAAAESAQALTLSMMMLSRQIHALALKQILTGAWASLSLASSRTPAQSAARQAKLVRDTMANSAVAASQLSTSAARLVKKGLKPIHSRATGNAKRLAKR